MSFEPILAENALLHDVHFFGSYFDSFHYPDDPTLEKSHIHSYYEVYLNVSGDVFFLVNNQVYSVKSGDLIISRPNEMHICIYQNPCVHEHYCFWFTAKDDSPLLDFFRSPNFQHRISAHSDTERKALFDIFKTLCSDAKDADLEKTTRFLQMLLFMKKPNLSDDTPTYSTTIPIGLQSILNDIDQRIGEIRHVRDLYNKHYVAPATLSRWFREYLHISPHDYLTTKRLAFAKQLLDNGATVTDACLQAGFSDCSHFIAVFKKRFAETPFRYKNGNH